MTSDQKAASGRTASTIATLGRVMTVSGSQVSIGLLADNGQLTDNTRVTVGKFVGIRGGSSLIVGVITDVSIQTPPDAREQGYRATARVDLMGEIRMSADRTMRFLRGVAHYPAIGDSALLLGPRELQAVYQRAGSNTVNIGHLHHDHSVGAFLRVDELLNKHFAILGTTGVGKSSGVGIILREILTARPDLRLFLLDPHNEYGKCFGTSAQVLNPGNLKLPFWLFNFEEMTNIFFGGRPGVQEEIDILHEVVPLARGMYNLNRNNNERLIAKRIDAKTTGYNSDTPVPYRLTDLLALIDERMGKLENHSTRAIYFRLINRIETVRNDPRYAFMFDNANVGGDTMAEVVGYLFRLPPGGVPMTVMQLGGFPTEVVDAVVSVLCRMAFDFGMWSNGAVPLLFVCEEAHRYAANLANAGFDSTRRALARIAKEGRKYGVYLGLVSQRPAELDATIISQCSTLFVMRLSNDRDQALLRSAVSDAAANLLSFVPSLATREVLVFGEGVALPTRLAFKSLPADFLLKGSDDSLRADPAVVDLDFLHAVIERWRGATTRQNVDSFPETEIRQALQTPPPPASSPSGFDRAKLLKQPIQKT